MELDHATVPGVILSVGGFLGVGDKLVAVPVDQIKGTAVEGPGQRGGDFLPLKDRRSDDWRSRWQRILGANERLEVLPPVELIKFGDDYWVVDGHNRVAAALYNGQMELDAVVEELRLPGMLRTSVRPWCPQIF